MAKFITRPIGSKFLCNGVELEVVNNTSYPKSLCVGCYFDADCDTCTNKFREITGSCSGFSREDCADVYFKEVNS